jgi:hypothetical protein
VLAPADQAKAGAEHRQAEIVVGVHGSDGADAALDAAERVRRALPARAAVLLLDAPSDPALEEQLRSRAGDAVLLGARRDLRDGPLETLLHAAVELGGAACALVSADRREGDGDGGFVRALLQPVIDDGFDLVWPLYVRHKLDGGLHTGVGAPFSRAVFGRPLRQPIASELALSRRLAEALLHEDELRSDPSHTGRDVVLLSHGIGRDFRTCQAVLGPPPAPAPQAGDVSDTLARAVGLLFHEAHRHPAGWQRVRQVVSIPTIGRLPAVTDEPRDIDVAAMREAFVRGVRELQRLWASVLPPQAMLALKRLAAQPADAFRMHDALWARVVFDFAVGYHASVMERGQLLRSMTPLYLGWMASYAGELGPLDGARAEERADALCRAFDLERPYLISRWRWPDRFLP